MKITIVKQGSVVKPMDSTCPWMVDVPEDRRQVKPMDSTCPWMVDVPEGRLQ